MEVVCPDAVYPGDSITVLALDGQPLNVVVPEGVRPGESFYFPLPSAAAVVVAPPSCPEVGLALSPEQGRELVMSLVEHASKVLNLDMQGFFEARSGVFDQAPAELASGQGETLQQYSAFQEYEVELERHFDVFVASRGFHSAQACFAAISGAVAADAVRQKQQMEKLEEQLKKMQRQWAQYANESNEASLEEGGFRPPPRSANGAEEEEDGTGSMPRMPIMFMMGGGGGGGDPDDLDGDADDILGACLPLMLFSQPISLEDILKHTLSLCEYTTFSILMRMKARQVAARRAWLGGQDARNFAAAFRAQRLEAPSGEDLRSSGLWSELRQRIEALSGGPPSGEAEEIFGGLAEYRARAFAQEDGFYNRLADMGEAIPDEGERRTLFSVLAGPLLRIAMFAMVPEVEQGISAAFTSLREAVERGEQGGAAICLQAVQAGHYLVDTVERNQDKAAMEAEVAGELARSAYA